MTSEINISMNAIELGAPELIPERSELLAILDTNEELPETQQPEAIKTSLKRQEHQKQALSFMLRRERGWAFDSSKDIWVRARGSQGHFFINLISNSHQYKEPLQFLGGIIADPMGLGKTLTMIALIATDLQGADFVDNQVPQDECNNTTLVVVPPPLIDTWEEQLSQHVQQGQLTWCRHHGKSRLMDSLETQSVNIVLTTYHTVSAEWKNGNKSNQSILFSTHWRRVVLDEAHFIRNTGSRMAKAICDLPSDVRWAVTGTPIQNRLSDLAALLKFLRVYPYDDMRRFDADISHLWKSRQAEEAVHRLKTLSRCLILRRPKATINLPSRTDLRYPVTFTPDERALYDDIKTQTIETIRKAAYGEASHDSPRFVNVIQQINLMRLICNLGLHYSPRHEHSTAYNYSYPQMTDWERIAQQTFNFQCEIATLTCELCGLSTNMTETLLEDSGATSKLLFSQCLRFFCSDCTQSPKRGASNLSCGHYPPHSMATVSLSRSAFEEDAIQAIPYTSTLSGTGLPSKVAALMRELSHQPADVKSVVFSTWRMTLDVVEQGLKQTGINHLRFDGKVPQKERKGIIDRFRKDPAVKVLLLTLTCGAVGLTLTEATRAYLMEPHWNPTMEEQALARVHRLGQTKEVTTVRFYVRDTFEERVMELQKKKEDLAGLLLDPQTGNTEHLEVAQVGGNGGSRAVCPRYLVPPTVHPTISAINNWFADHNKSEPSSSNNTFTLVSKYGMALLGWSLILASVVYIAIRRPPLIDTFIALFRRSPSIQQPPSTRPPSSATATADGNKTADQGGSSAVSVAGQGTPVRRVKVKVEAETDGSTPKTLSVPSSEVKVAITDTDAETPVVTIASSPSSSPSSSPETTPKVTATTTLANGNANGAIPSFSLSPSTADPPASAAAVARATASSTIPTPTLSALPIISPAMSMLPPPRPPKLNNLTTTSNPTSSLLAAPQARLSPLPKRQAQYDRQPGTSTLAPPPTHSSKPTKPSRKVTLEPGHSPLDWARLANHPTSDLRGLGAGAAYLRVTPSMLRRQTGRRGKDAWTALGGRVYNITPYLPFHPGGEPELLRTAGRDGTKLFGEIHPWVNYETMLSSCLIGLLVDETEAQSSGDMEAMD
ncbi:hypothetical protein E0Z10_g6083 [Xylaria hypoxylon]|uniref:Cytochrome b5 heme-binding domain-containing protein n=1 Tax=Xylaria hypoxylon TaxID=37992 RepID=A0A4Z0YZE4_9PEZI|nr:hypothetical protein E0Z10_g6083 [Xylaria hypoxylon]